jgi:hypothetical protein
MTCIQGKVRVNGFIQKTSIQKIHTTFVQEPLACISVEFNRTASRNSCRCGLLTESSLSDGNTLPAGNYRAGRCAPFSLSCRFQLLQSRRGHGEFRSVVSAPCGAAGKCNVRGCNCRLLRAKNSLKRLSEKGRLRTIGWGREPAVLGSSKQRAPYWCWIADAGR